MGNSRFRPSRGRASATGVFCKGSLKRKDLTLPPIFRVFPTGRDRADSSHEKEERVDMKKPHKIEAQRAVKQLEAMATDGNPACR
jgi:hypothetical protein